jgi:hypothetical protein
LVVSKGVGALRFRMLVQESVSGLARRNEPRKVITKRSCRGAFICCVIYIFGVFVFEKIDIMRKIYLESL